MGDRGKALVGLGVFTLLVTLPLWGRLAGGQPIPGRDDLVYPDPSKATECIEDRDWMTANHMNLLNRWRDDLVRRGVTEYVSRSGKRFYPGLTQTCLDCHDDRDNFCNRCHEYVHVTPTCWECHTTPGGGA